MIGIFGSSKELNACKQGEISTKSLNLCLLVTPAHKLFIVDLLSTKSSVEDGRRQRNRCQEL